MVSNIYVNLNTIEENHVSKNYKINHLFESKLSMSNSNEELYKALLSGSPVDQFIRKVIKTIT